jgi:hypothetical protein
MKFCDKMAAARESGMDKAELFDLYHDNWDEVAKAIRAAEALMALGEEQDIVWFTAFEALRSALADLEAL